MTKLEAIQLLEEANCEKAYAHTNCLKFWQKGAYELSHGEYDRPTFYVRKIRNIDGYYILGEFFYHPGTFGAQRDGDVTEMIRDMAAEENTACESDERIEKEEANFCHFHMSDKSECV